MRICHDGFKICREDPAEDSTVTAVVSTKPMQRSYTGSGLVNGSFDVLSPG